MESGEMMTSINRHPAHAAFTLIELLVVMGVIAALAGIGYPIMVAVQQRANVQATRGLVQSVSTAIATYSTKTWTVSWDHDHDDPDLDGWDVPGVTRATPQRTMTVPLWDLNQGPAANPTTGAGELEGDTPAYFTATYPGEPSNPYIDPTKEGEIDGYVALVAASNRDGPFWDKLIHSGYGGFIAMTQAPIHRRFIAPNGQPRDAWGRPLRISWDAKRFPVSGFGVWSTGKDKIKPADDLVSWSANED
jgi:prepilin-type N-terminal cleavage/methylation domain-containing protein